MEVLWSMKVERQDEWMYSRQCWIWASERIHSSLPRCWASSKYTHARTLSAKTSNVDNCNFISHMYTYISIFITLLTYNIERMDFLVVKIVLHVTCRGGCRNLHKGGPVPLVPFPLFFPSPSPPLKSKGKVNQLGIWGSVVRSPSGVRGRALTENEFDAL